MNTKNEKHKAHRQVVRKFSLLVHTGRVKKKTQEINSNQINTSDGREGTIQGQENNKQAERPHRTG